MTRRGRLLQEEKGHIGDPSESKGNPANRKKARVGESDRKILYFVDT